MPHRGDPSRSIRIVLAEDHTIVRQGLEALLGSAPDMTVVAAVDDGHDAIAAVAEANPDVVIMDVSLPGGLDGVEATRTIAAEHPQTRVLMLSMHASEALVGSAVEAGAAGYLVKGADIGELADAVRAVAGGATYFGAGVRRPDDAWPKAALRLTTREREVLELVALGLSSADIAARLHVSRRTVEGHRANLMTKFEVSNVAGLVAQAYRSGYVRPDPDG